MFGSLGAPELIFILLLALLIFGPRKLPEIGKTLGRGLSEFRKASNDLKRSINAELIDEEVRQADPRRIVREAIAAAPGSRSEPTASGEESADSGAPEEAGEDERSGERPPEAPSRTVARGRPDTTASESPEPSNE